MAVARNRAFIYFHDEPPKFAPNVMTLEVVNPQKVWFNRRRQCFFYLDSFTGWGTRVRPESMDIDEERKAFLKWAIEGQMKLKNPDLSLESCLRWLSTAPSKIKHGFTNVSEENRRKRICECFADIFWKLLDKLVLDDSHKSVLLKPNISWLDIHKHLSPYPEYQLAAEINAKWTFQRWKSDINSRLKEFKRLQVEVCANHLVRKVTKYKKFSLHLSYDQASAIFGACSWWTVIPAEIRSAVYSSVVFFLTRQLQIINVGRKNVNSAYDAFRALNVSAKTTWEQLRPRFKAHWIYRNNPVLQRLRDFQLAQMLNDYQTAIEYEDNTRSCAEIERKQTAFNRF